MVITVIDGLPGEDQCSGGDRGAVACDLLRLFLGVRVGAGYCL